MSRLREALAPVGMHLGMAAKDLIWATCNRHRQGDAPNIAVFGSRRSGSTLLMEVVAANRGVKFINQPFSVFSASAFQTRLLPIKENGQLHHLDPAEADDVRAYIRGIESGRYHVNEPWRVFRRDFDFRSNRIVFKITDAHAAAAWLVEAFGWQPIVLTRHPLSQIASVARNGWRERANAFLFNEAYCAEYLTVDQVARLRGAWAGRDSWTRHSIGWALENLPLLRLLAAEPSWDLVTYESLLVEPDAVIDAMGRAYGLGDVERMRATVGRASLSVRRLSAGDRQQAIGARDVEALLGNWRKRVSAEQEAITFDIIEDLGIDLYRRGLNEPSTLWRVGTATSTAANDLAA